MLCKVTRALFTVRINDMDAMDRFLRWEPWIETRKFEQCDAYAEYYCIILEEYLQEILNKIDALDFSVEYSNGWY